MIEEQLPKLPVAPKNKRPKLAPISPPKKKQQMTSVQEKVLRYEKGDSLKTITLNGKRYTQETDKKFVESIKEIAKTQEGILDDLIGMGDNALTDLECEEIHFRATRHREANIVNLNSTKEKKDAKEEKALMALYCRSGCERFEGQNYPLCSSLHDIPILGAGIILYFFFLKALFLNFLLFAGVYGFFALVSNLEGGPISTSKCTNSYCDFREESSDQTKQRAEEFSQIQSWIGLGGMFIWLVITRFLIIYGRYMNEMIDQGLDSASDYAIKVDNLPYGEYNEQELLQYFQRIWERQQQMNEDHREVFREVFLNHMPNKGKIHPQSASNSGEEQRKDNSLDVLGAFGVNQAIAQEVEPVLQFRDDSKTGIRAIQIIYNMEFSRKIVSKMQELSNQLTRLLKTKEDKEIVKDKDKYTELKVDLIKAYELCEDLRKKFLNDSNFRRQISTRSAIIEFRNEEDKKWLLDKYGKQNVSLFKRIRQKLKTICFDTNSQLIFKGRIPDIMRAPQPTDIIWTNCEQLESVCRLLLIYLITGLIILLSFGLMVGFEFLQRFIIDRTKVQSDDGEQGNSSLVTVLNVLTAILIQVVNKALWITTTLLVSLEYNHTSTNTITSMMSKSSAAMWVNVIALPIIVNYIISDNYYGANGLAGIVFDYHITSLAVILFTKMLDPISLIIKIATGVRCIRNWLIRTRYQHPPNHLQGQISQTAMKKVYSLYEAPQFETAQYYTFISAIMAHALFFAPLQPIILLICTIEVGVFYWFSKVRVLRFTNVPKLTEVLIFDSACYQAMLGPALFGGGLLFDSYVANQQDPNRPFIILAGIICCGLSVLSYANPKDIFGGFLRCIADCCCWCLSPEAYFSKEIDRLKEEQDKGTIKKRVENYYKDSNSLTLLGFESALRGEGKGKEVEKELKHYCEGQVLKDLKARDKQDSFESEDSDQTQKMQRVNPLQDRSIFELVR